ncbi:MAG: ATP-binding cassette domain-containing protein [Pseudomonadota bacterium]
MTLDLKQTSLQDSSLPQSGVFMDISPQARQLVWAFQRVAATTGQSLDRLQLHDALKSLDMTCSPEVQLKCLCSCLDWPEPSTMTELDIARLPALIHDKSAGWCVVVAQNADGTWLAHTPGLQKNISGAEQGIVCLRLNPPARASSRQLARDMIVKAFWQYRSIMFDGVLATVLINSLALASSFFSMQVYDRVIPTQGLHTLWILGVGVGLAIVFEFALKVVRSRVMEYAVVGLDAQLSRNIFQRLLSVRLDQLPASVGTLAGQLRAYEGIRAFLTASTAYLLVDVPFSIFFIVIIGLLATPALLLIPLVFLVISLFIGLFLRSSIDSSAKAGAREGNLKTGLLVEAVEGAETIKAGQGGWRFLSRWIDVTERAIRNDLKVRQLSEIGGYMTATLQQLSYAALVAMGAWLVIDGQMTMGALIACSILSGRALAPLGMLPGLLVQYAHAKAALAGLEKVYALATDNAEIERALLPEKLQGHFTLENVSYNYGSQAGVGSRPALSIPKLEIEAGQKVGVLGPVGSGKSTLLRLLSGMYQPQEGRILLDKLELSHISRQCVSEQVGYLQQDHRLFEGTLRDNMLIGLPDLGDAALISAAQKTGLMALIADHPKGLDLPIAEGGKGLSGGQKQLLAFTRLILVQPRIWLLDEPTASMDDELERKCLAVLKDSLTPERTAIVVTHKPSILPMMTHLIVVSQHRILLSGPRDEVLQSLKAIPTKNS